MIVVVHSLYFVLQYALRWYRRRQLRQEIQQRQLQAAEGEQPATLPLDPEECFTFPFPVYRQRYSAVQDVLLDARWRKNIQTVVDFGCAEFGFFQYLKHLLGVTNVLEVDIDETLLRENMYRVQPLTADYLKQRSCPLSVEILRGSISDPDRRIKGADAIIGIEIIEHLYPDTLEALPYNIFGFAQPRLAIFTTPNADFNVLFPNFKGFRHDDHKFEWTREQFQDWSENIVTRFPNYSVSFCGVGKGPKGTESLGCCSQMAVFVKEYDVVQSELEARVPDVADWSSHGVCTYYSFTRAQMALLTDELCDAPRKRADEFYSTIETIEYPFYEDKRTPDEKLLHEAVQQIFRHATPNSRYFNEDTGVVEIPLYEVVTNFEGTFATEAEIKAILEAAKYTVAECALYGTEERCECVLYDIEMAGRSSRATSECEPPDEAWEARATDDANLRRNVNSSAESDWELDDDAAATARASKDETATPSDPLVDSGYQKSLSNAEWSPQSPLDGQFDDQFAPRMDVNDIKDSIRGGAKPGTSARRRKGAVGGGAANRRSDSEDSSSARDDVKSITDVLVYNSLNRLDIAEPAEGGAPEEAARPRNLELPQFIVENGDVANNNLDREGNNYPDEEAPPPGVAIDDLDPNENVDERLDRDDAENRNVRFNHDDGIVADVPVVEIVDVHVAPPPAPHVEEEEEEEEEELNHASREALFDPNSTSDLLEDGSITDDTDGTDADAEPPPSEEESVLPVDNMFPHWLLQLLGGASDDDAGARRAFDDEDEAHFYCQGDGLGVHPSVVEIDVETTSSSSSATDAAVAERTLSENDVGSLPIDGAVVAAPSAIAVLGRALELPQTSSSISQDSAGEEFYDTLGEPSDADCEPAASEPDLDPSLRPQ